MLYGRDRPVGAAGYLLARFARFFFAAFFGTCGAGGVLSIRRSTSSGFWFGWCFCCLDKGSLQ